MFYLTPKMVAMEELALNGGKPVSERWIPISKPMIGDEEVNEVTGVLRSGMLREGRVARLFEEEFRKLCGVKHAITMSSGTAALHLGFLATIEPGDEVIVPSFSFVASANAIILAGGKPVFADIDERTFTLDPDDVLEKITSKTRAIEPVHLYGQPADVKAFLDIAEDHDLCLVWDAAQAHGAEYGGRNVGSFRDVVCFSFYATKNMTTGEGGMVTTDDDGLAERIRLMKTHGQIRKYWHVMLGFNYRMTDIQAAIGLHQLRKLERFNEARIRNAEFLTKEFSKIDCVEPPYVREGVKHVYHQYTIKLKIEELKCSRDEFIKALRAENIDAAVHYPTPIHMQPLYRKLTKDVRLPVTEDVCGRVVSLPVHPALTEDHLRTIVRAVEKVVMYFHR